jgi:hypothetical protein
MVPIGLVLHKPSIALVVFVFFKKRNNDMKASKPGFALALVLCLCAVQPNAVAGLAEGMAALQKADYGVALKELRKLCITLPVVCLM